MAAVIPLTPKAAETKRLLYWMERVLEERQHVIASPDEDSVHDLRVALRRCRSLASVFEEIDAHPAWRALRKTSKKLFRSLGVIRDAQVQEAWALKQAGADDPLRGQILYALKAGHLKRERDAKKSTAKFDEKDWVRLACARACDCSPRTETRLSASRSNATPKPPNFTGARCARKK